MADAEGSTETKPLAGLFNVAWALVRVFLGGFLAMMGIGIVGGLIAAAVAYLFGNYIVAALASLLLSAGSVVIRWAGAIFNFFIEHLITKYSATLGTLGIMDGINVVWAAFRDVANIAIIGIFVFIAINIILGVKEFGDRRMVARVLVIATLINFSLLFSKVIIDATNFTAYQFYKSAGLETASQRASTGGASPGGVADVFLNAAGITTIGDTYNGVKALADKNMGAALAFTVVAALLLFVMVGLLLYGAFQMIVRSILLIFLMITSPLAFASWIAPNAIVEASWSKWWRALISAAFFSPLFMMMLWASMLLIQRAAQARGNTTLGEFFTNPTVDTQAWTLIVVYCFAAGLLYGSIRFASTFASSISGFSIVSQGLRNAFVGIPALGWRFGVAPLARQTYGRFAYFRRDALLQKAKDQGEAAGEIRQSADLARLRGDITKKQWGAEYNRAKGIDKSTGRLMGAARVADTFAKAGYNLGDAGLAKQIAKASGISELIAGQRPKEIDVGFKQQIESKVKSGEEMMKSMEVKQGDRQKMLEKAREEIAEKNEAEAARRQQAHREAESKYRSEQNRVDRDDGGHVGRATARLNDMKARSAAIREEATRAAREAVSGLSSQLARTSGSGERAHLEGLINNHVTTRDNRIKTAEADVEQAKKTLGALTAPLEEAKKGFKDTGDALDNFARDLEGSAQAVMRERTLHRQVGNVGVAERAGRVAAGRAERVASVFGGKVVGEVSGALAKNARSKIGAGNLKSVLQRIKREFGDEYTEVAEE